MTPEELAQFRVKKILSNKRYTHSINVAELAKELAIIHGVDAQKAYLAGMYHDICKEKEDFQILDIVCHENTDAYPTIKTMHGLAGALYIKNVYGITDTEILNAVTRHVLANGNLSKLDKILYVSDKIEPGRTKWALYNRDEIYEISKTNLDLAFKMTYDESQEVIENNN